MLAAILSILIFVLGFALGRSTLSRGYDGTITPKITEDTITYEIEVTSVDLNRIDTKSSVRFRVAKPEQVPL